MCHAYEGERNYLIASERAAREAGKQAFKDGKALSINPHFYGYNKTAWAEGWEYAQWEWQK